MADHGNSEELIDPLTGEQDTRHSARNVPLVIIGQSLAGQGSGKGLEALAREAPIGSLVDVAPTTLALLGIPKPAEMTGSSLLQQ